MAEWERVVRKLGDVVADMNAQRDIEAVLDRIAASLCELTGADAGGFVLIEDGRPRLVSMEGLPPNLRGRTFEEAAPIAEEARNPRRHVQVAVLLSCLLIGCSTCSRPMRAPRRGPRPPGEGASATGSRASRRGGSAGCCATRRSRHPARRQRVRPHRGRVHGNPPGSCPSGSSRHTRSGHQRCQKVTRQIQIQSPCISSLLVRKSLLAMSRRAISSAESAPSHSRSRPPRSRPEPKLKPRSFSSNSSSLSPAASQRPVAARYEAPDLLVGAALLGADPVEGDP
jgi:hypothetical protein